MSTLVGQRLGPYKLVEFLGEGGVSSVYRAHHLKKKDVVAIKVVKPSIAEINDFVVRIKREAVLSANLKHPHILDVIGYGQSGKTVYMVMQLLKGGNLADLAQKSDLSLSEISRLLDKVASALDYIHELGIVHRDVKLENVLMDEEGHPFLSDFGMVKAASEATKGLIQLTDMSWYTTKGNMLIGTPSYMSPEQCKAEPVDSRSDVYSLGIVLFELLTGQLPFISESSIETMYSHIKKTPPLVTSIKPELPTIVDEVVQRALAKNPDERFQSAGKLAAAFRAAALANDETLPSTPKRHTVEVAPPRPAKRPKNPSGSYSSTPLLFGFLSVLAVASIIVLALMFLLNVRP